MKSKKAGVAKWVALAVAPLILAGAVRYQAQQRRAAETLETVLELVPTSRSLKVRLSIVNSSDRYQIFSRMNCSWDDNWRCDNPAVVLMGHSCDKNTWETVILPPGQSYHEEAWPLLIRGVKPEETTFRFGLVRARSDFTSEELERIYRSGQAGIYFSRGDIGNRFKREEVVFWSNQATVLIRPEWISR